MVPNPSLLHNHQLELAEELARLGYVVHGALDALGDAVEQVDGEHGLRRKLRAWPPLGSGEERAGMAERRGKAKRKGEIDRGDLGRVLDEEMGWVD